MSRTFRHSRTHKQFFAMTAKGNEKFAKTNFHKLLTDNLYPFYKSELFDYERKTINRFIRHKDKQSLKKDPEFFIPVDKNQRRY